MGNCGSTDTAAELTPEELEVQQLREQARAKKLGWRRDLPDFRDRVLSLPRGQRQNLPKSKDLRVTEEKGGDFLGFPVYDQGALGSCTANAIGAAFHFDQLRQGIQDFAPSRLFIYYNEREREGTTERDSGAYIRDGIKSVHQKGVCSEMLWPYETEGQQFKDKPDEVCYAAALKSRCLQYARVNQTLEEMKACLNEGLPFVFGFVVYKSFYSREVATKGEMSMPKGKDEPLEDGEMDEPVGGHAVLAVGYDDESKVFIVRNSWGEDWGVKGYFFMPYEYLSDCRLASDLWVMSNVSGLALPTVGISRHADPLAAAAAPAAAKMPQEGTLRSEK